MFVHAVYINCLPSCFLHMPQIFLHSWSFHVLLHCRILHRGQRDLLSFHGHTGLQKLRLVGKSLHRRRGDVGFFRSTGNKLPRIKVSEGRLSSNLGMRNEYFRLPQVFYNLLESPNFSIKILEYIFVVPTVLLKMSRMLRCLPSSPSSPLNFINFSLRIWSEFTVRGDFVIRQELLSKLAFTFMSRMFKIIFVTRRFSIMQFIPYIYTYICSSNCFNSEI